MRLRLALLMLTAGLVGSAEADERNPMIDAFASVCPAALLAPDALPGVLADNGLTKAVALPLAGVRSDAYASADDTVTATVVTHTFGDATHRACIVGSLTPIDFSGITAARAALEANPLVGPLEGKVLPLLGIVTAYLKRPGNDPLVSTSLNATRSAATLTLDSWDLTP